MNLRILVADDDPDLLSGTARLLERAGYAVDTASSGEESLQAIQRRRPDLLLLDRDLTGIDGLEVCRRIKGDPLLAGVFVVLVSGSPIESDEEAEGLEAGSEGTITRPIASRELLARVESYVRILRLTRSLRESEAKWRTLFEILPVGISIVDEHRATSEVNPALGRILGISEEGLRDGAYGQRRCLRGDGTPMPEEELPGERALREKCVIQAMEVGFVKEDGGIVWTEVSAAPLRLPDSACVVATVDITGRKQAEEARRAQEARCRAIIDASPVSMALNDEQQRITFLNPAFVQTFGYTREEIPTLAHWWPVAYPDPEYRQWVADTWHAELERSQRTGSAFTPMELSVRCRNGTNRTVLASAAPLSSSFEGVHLVVLYDITERKQAEAALRDGHRALVGILETTLDGFWRTDRQGKLLDVNRSYCEQSGYSREELLGMRIPDLEAAESVAETAEHMRRLTESGRERFESTHRRKDGSTWYVEVSTTYGEVAGGQVFAFLRDISERKRAQVALRDSEGRYRTQFDLASEGIFTMSAEGKLLEVNQAFAAMHGYTPEEMAHTDLKDLDTPESFKGVPERMRRLLAGEAMTIEVEHVHRDGHRFPLEVSASRVTSGGRPVILCFHRDITERKRTEAALRESEERFNTAFQFTPVALAISTQEEGVFLDVNRAFEAIYGYAKEELVGRKGRAVGIWANPEDRGAVLARLKAGEAVRGVEIRARRRDGSVVWVSYSGQLVNMNGVPCVLSGRVDITDRKEAEAKLIESEAYLRAIIENEPECIKIIDAQGLLLEMNPAGLAMIEADSLEQVAGREVLGIIVPESREAFAALHERVLAGETMEMEYEVLGFRGGRRWLETHAVPMLSKGKVVHLAVTRDITGRKRAEEDRRHFEAQLQQAQKMESLGSLAGGVAHDMNNVLGAILGLASANLESQPVDSAAHRAFDTIAKAAVRGGSMVKSLLSFARKSPAEEREVDLNTILREEILLLERTTLAKVRLELDLATELRPVRGDASALSHALMNLCVNAVEAMPENGTLTLRTRIVDDDWIQVLVEDTGSGMSREVRERAFDPFFTTKEQGKGTGLGLSMAYSTVKAHRGQMEIQSEPGQGTRVSIWLPACEPSAEAAEPADEPRSEPSRGSLSVLLVDDDLLIQSSMEMILEMLGHATTVVSSGEEALAKLEAGLEPDVVMLDMNMPGLGGAGTLPRLRALRPTLPVLLATGRVDQSALDLAAAHPHVLLLSKPFRMKELEAYLETVGRTKTNG